MRLAQVNVARLRWELDSPRLAGFVAAVDGVNLLAEASPGFVWRLRAGHGPVATADGDPRLVVNVSVWETYEHLHAFVYRGRHGGLVRRRAEWFTRTPSPYVALWWVADDAQPSAADALRRLEHLRRHGPSPRAFTVRRRFPP
ncbi:DUF3291 domain-containing protein [Jiangella sp. DSM 45060]|uniref:DUF3291 domain-containing protein n=1 Tax=Jiangella sp. DSM 45060 TaxID=1798224 RepID=UPI00087DDFD0|nr:DUF3291 domain-containing protein [Jiangella sp. DSM 45060]SDS60960.1 protein of unknown function [Jiangella sp. DSM 45060]